MKFFVPGTADTEEALGAWQEQRQECEASHHYPLSDGKIFKILYDEVGESGRVAAQVGQINWVAQDRVLAIFAPDDPDNPQGTFLVATHTKTLAVNKEQVVSVEPFEQ
jgi:hypothetical protein